MTTEERIKLAKAKVETIISLLRTLIQIRANNEFLLLHPREASWRIVRC